MSIQITEAVALRLSALLSLLLASGGNVAAYVFMQYPPDQHPVAKAVGVAFGALGVVGLVAQAQSKSLFHKKGNVDEVPQ